MRIVLSLATGGLGVIAAAAFMLTGGPGAGAQSNTVVPVGDLWFCDSSFENGVCETTVTAGDTVQWDWVGSEIHTTTHCADNLDDCSGPHLWDSPIQASGSFSHTFNTPGSFLYRCQVHPFEMRGVINVVEAAEPTPTAEPDAPDEDATQPAPGALGEVEQPSDSTDAEAPAAGGPAAVPTAGGEPPLGGSSVIWWAVIASGGLLLASASALLLRARSRRA